MALNILLLISPLEIPFGRVILLNFYLDISGNHREKCIIIFFMCDQNSMFWKQYMTVIKQEKQRVWFFERIAMYGNSVII